MKVLIKRFLALFGAIIIVCCVSCAESETTNDSTNTTTEDTHNMPLLLTDANVSQESRLSMMKASAIKENNGYLDSDEVSLIIELDSDSLIDEYINVYSTKYDTIADYARSPEGIKKAQQITKEQNSFIQKLESKGYIDTTLYQYNTVMNGIAIKTTYGNLAKIDALDNVSHTYMSETYNLPQSTSVADDGAVTNVVDVYETGIFDSSSVPYDGEGTSVAILDSGFDITHEVFQNCDPETPAISREDVADVLEETVAYKNTTGLIVDDVYKNVKVPFAFDYADYDFDVEPTTSNHGTHVAGIIGGKYDGEITTVDGSTYDSFTGVATKTQLVLMKVFSDLTDGADTEDLLAGLEDAVLLQVDAINMSLGTSCGFSREYDNQALNEVYNNINNAGISLVVAASNSYSSGFGGEDSNTNKVTNPESSTVGSPSTYYGALSVASISGTKSNYIVGPDNFIFFYEESSSYSSGNYYNNFYNDLDIKGTDDVEIKYVTVPGYGLRSNYSGIDVEGKIALVKRGDNTFEEKCAIAQDEGARGIIIYNNIPGDITMSTGKVTDFPAISVTKDVGDILAKNKTGILTFNGNYEAGPFMSDFSSWGPTSDLKLKPEITAHGGNIVSAVPGGGYDKLSGTSMACPNMCGIVVLVRQYLKEKYPDYTAKQISDMAYQLLMSTATIALNEEGNPYSPRKQGAGLASLEKATTTGAYITVNDNPGNGLLAGNRPKLELGDDKDRTGVYEMAFNVVNISNQPLSYEIAISGMTESVSSSDKDYVAEMSYMLNGALSVYEVSDNIKLDGKIITIPANTTGTVIITYTLTAEDKKYIEDSFPYGMYVEGYVELIATDENNNISLNAPFLAFFGDWTEAPIFDKTFYEVESEAYDDSIDDEDKIKADYYATVPFGTYYDSYVISLGTYVYNMDLTQYSQIPAREDHIAISSNAGTINGINGIYTGLLRNVAKMVYTITDNVTGEVIYNFTDYNCNKAFNNSGAGAVPYFERLSIDPIALDMVNNREYTFKMQAYMDYGDGGISANVRSNYTFNFTMDDEAPIILGADYEKVYDKTLKKDRYYVTLTVSDNQYVQSVTPIVFTENGANYTTLTTYPYPVYGDKGEKTTVKFEITDYMESVYFDDVSHNTLGFVIDDYALNSNIYLCSMPGTKGNLKFTSDGTMEGTNKTQQIINAGEVVDLTQYLTSDDSSISMGKDYLEYLDWTSSNPDVAIVDKGQVIGLKAGTTTITVSNPTFNVGSASLTVRVSGTSNDAIDDAKLESINFIYFDVINGHPAAGESNVLGNETDRTFISSLPTNNIGASVLSVYPGETIKLTYNIEPWYLPESRYEVTYTSTNQKVATVTQDGEVTSLAEGTTTIRLTIKVDGKQSNMMALLSLTVKDPFVIENRVLNYYKGVGGDIIIPDDEGIMQIGSYAFSLYNIDYNIPVTEDDLDANKVPQTNTTITSVVIPEGVTTIGKMAFASLVNLEKVVLPSTVTTIEEMAFMNCPKLKEINLENVTTIEYEAFKGCTSLETVDLSDVYSVSYNVFEGCTSLNNVDLTTLRSSGKEIFKDCTSLTNIVITPNTKLSNGMFAGSGLTSVTLGQDRIPDYCFQNCHNLVSVTFTNDLVYIGTSAFENTGLSQVNFAKGVEYFYARAFANCQNLVTLALPNSEFTLADEVFKDSSNLTTLEFAQNTKITKVGLDVFANTNLTNFVASSDSNYSVSDNSGVLLSADGTKIIFVAPMANITDYEVPSSVTEITEGAFANNNTLETLTITNPNTTIAANAFANCSNLTTINLPSEAGVKILDYAFYDNANLTTINNLDKVIEIGSYSFANSGLTNVVVNTDIGSYAFAGSKLTSITTGANISINDHAFYGNTALKTVVLGDNVTINNYAFAACSALNSINLEKANGTLGDYAFYQDKALTAINLDNITTIGAYAFAECSNLTNVSLPVVETIGAYAFSKEDSKAIAPRMTTISLPTSLKTIGEGAFKDLMYLANVSLPEGLVNLGKGAFSGCSDLETVVLPSTLTIISEEAFRDCSKLSSINLENIEVIGKNSFINCKALTKINLASATTINYGAFASNTNLVTVENANLVTYVGDYAFQSAKFSTISLPQLAYIGQAAFSSCPNLVEFTLSDDLVYVGTNAFFSSNALKEFNYNDNGTKKTNGQINSYALLDNGILYTYAENGYLALNQVPAALDIETLEVLDNTQIINPYAGNMNTNVKHLIFPDTLSVISNFAFYGYTALESVEFRSFTAPKLESFMIEDTEISPTDPGYEFFNYAYHLWTNPYPYYQFKNRVGSIATLQLILPANTGVIGYDTLIYEGYFGDIANATHSDYVAKDNNTLAFLEIVNKVPAVADVTLDDDDLITEAVTCLNALSQDLTQFGYTSEEVAQMKAKVEDARYQLYALKRAQGSEAVRNVQAILDNLDTTFDLANLEELANIASQINALSRDEQNILDLRNYDKLKDSYNLYLQKVEEDAKVVDNITTNGYNYSLVTSLVAATSLLGVSLALILKGLL